MSDNLRRFELLTNLKFVILNVKLFTPMHNIGHDGTYKKFQESSHSTSTPNSVPVYGRKSIHPDKSVSPIGTFRGNNASPQPLSRERAKSNQERAASEIHSDSAESEASSDYDEEDNYSKSDSYESSKSYSHTASYTSNYSSSKPAVGKFTPNIKNQSERRVSNTLNVNVVYGCLGIGVLSVIAVILSVISKNTVATANSVTIEKLQDCFPLQTEDVWNALESGIAEVKKFKKPSVFLLLYEEAAEETVNLMLKNISKYATCILNENCELQPIVLTSAVLGSEKAKRDYGYLIDKYKAELEKKGVMIVKNLDQIPGMVAQVFHSMCDEYTPLVEKTVFFFTIRLENLKKSSKRDVQVVEEILKTNWNDLDDDIFYPLFTRISNMILRVVPEKM